MEKKITIKDIAKEANVSITTVSHVINNSRFVKKETEKRVLEVINKYNYMVDVSASSLRGKATKLIGIVIPDISNLVFAKFIKKIEELFFENRYSITVCNSNNDIYKENYYIDVLKSRNVDGMIIFPAKSDSEHLKKITKKIEVPFVIIEREIKTLFTDTILVDAFKGFYNATNFLISLGHKKIGYLVMNHSKVSFRGFLKALQDNGLEINRRHWTSAKSSHYEDGYKSMMKILSMDDKPTAIIAYDDFVAIGAIRAIRSNDYLIPDDFSIIGFNNIVLNDYLIPSLTSITFPVDKIATIAAEIIIKRLEGDNSPPRLVNIEPKLIERESVAEPGKRKI